MNILVFVSSIPGVGLYMLSTSTSIKYTGGRALCVIYFYFYLQTSAARTQTLTLLVLVNTLPFK